MAEPPPVAKQHRVHRMQRLRLRRKLMQQRNHRLFRRIGNVETREPPLFSIGKHRGKSLLAAGQQVKVEEFITDLQAERLALIHVHGRARGVLDPSADQAGEVRAIGGFKSHNREGRTR
jgi:hypothetical protein